MSGQLVYTFADCGIGSEFPSDHLTREDLENHIVRKAKDQRIDIFVHPEDNVRVLRIDRDIAFNKTREKCVAPIREAAAGIINSRSRRAKGFKRDERMRHLRASSENTSAKEKACT